MDVKKWCDNEKILIKNNEDFLTYLKSFYYTQQWTNE